MTRTPVPRFDHLLAMTDGRGTFEHACFADPRPEHGYCTDDMARVLIVASREREPAPGVQWLVRLALQFLDEAQVTDGAYRNRMDAAGGWTDEASVEDCWGRSIWGLGTAAARSEQSGIRDSAVAQFERAAQQRSPWPRAMAFAAVGAAEVLTVLPDNQSARRLLADYAGTVIDGGVDLDWPWPEQRLRYANAVLAEARIVTGRALGHPALLRRGLRMLEWLIEDHTVGGHLSPSPAAGRALGDTRPGYDQQPIEVSTLADACARAAEVDPRDIWPTTVLAAMAWFEGDNDLGLAMWNPLTGGGFDGLHADGVNQNQGAESTLALLSTIQQAQRFSMVSR
ncbi:glycosyl transferase [Mycobacterium antarcticum]|uniref:glycosyltransferase n=1 Tax=Mycolicibacterium sp. TUM20985 TaxID=3023370 RepID=UPI0025736520|nr:glycosyltransferase [Mycolicibacterium sp. TUM20985]BDX33512.1 glycosyl transferase [Mycolicibacterium sp. TUM20985]